MPNSRVPFVLGKNSASLVKMINNLYKERTNDGSNAEQKGPEVVIGKVLTEEEFSQLSSTDQARYLRGE